MEKMIATNPDRQAGEHRYREAQFILSSLDSTVQPAVEEKRMTKRYRYRVQAELKLFSDDREASPRVLYTRDINARGAGFVCTEQMPLGHAGVVHLPRPDGTILQVYCTVLRCRNLSPQWFEGAIAFTREQTGFTEEALPVATS